SARAKSRSSECARARAGCAESSRAASAATECRRCTAPRRSPCGARRACEGACRSASSRGAFRRRALVALGDVALAAGDFDRVENLGVAGAATEVAAERLFDLVAVGLWVAFEQRRRREHHAALAEAALQRAAEVERVLHRVHLAAVGEAF